MKKHPILHVLSLLTAGILCLGGCQPQADPGSSGSGELTAAALTGYEGAAGVSHTAGELQHGVVSGRYYEEMSKDPDAYFDRFADLNMGWLRIEFEEYMSGDMEQNIERYKIIVDAAHKRGIKVMGLVATNAMPGGTGFPLTDEGIAAYVEAVKWHLETYPVDAVEMLNEPLGFIGGGDPGILAGCAKALIATYTALKPLYPDILFVAPTTANAEIGEWLGEDWQTGEIADPELSLFNNAAMMAYRDEHDGKLPLDVVSFHPYGTGGDPNGNFYFGRSFDTFFNEILNYADLKGRKIIGDTPIWFTEYGWNTSNVSYNQQKKYLASFTECCKKYPQIQVLFWYTWQDDEPVPNSEGNCHGLLHNSLLSYQPKQSYYQFCALSSGTGRTADADFDQYIIDCYQKNGGYKVLGYPQGEVRMGEGVSYQVFADRNGKKSAVLHPDGVPAAYCLAGAFYDYYLDGEGLLRPEALTEAGLPVAAAVTDGKTVRQDAVNGTLQAEAGEDKAVLRKSKEPLAADIDDKAAQFLNEHGDTRTIVSIREKVDFWGREKIGTATGLVEEKEMYVQHFTGGSLGDMVIAGKNLVGGDAYLFDQAFYDYIVENWGQKGLYDIESDVYVTNGRKFLHTSRGLLRYYDGVVEAF